MKNPKIKIKETRKSKLNNKMSEEERIAIALRPFSDEQINALTPTDLRIALRGEQNIRRYYEELVIELEKIKKENEALADKLMMVEGLLVRIKTRVFCPSSEKNKGAKKSPVNKGEKDKKPRGTRSLEARYPDANIKTETYTFVAAPKCPCCDVECKNLGLVEESSKLTVIPKTYLISKIQREKWGCTKCHSYIVTAPVTSGIVDRSLYSDEFIMDVALSKYCDLLPIERYCEMAKRGGLAGLPANSLHELVLRFAQFLSPVYEKIRTETLDSELLLGDETRHRMLEGSDNSKWYIWNFNSPRGIFYECHETRAGAVAADVLSESGCRYFLSDAYSGYELGIREANDLRLLADRDILIESALCNAHARRYFNECTNDEAKRFIQFYMDIYKIESQIRKLANEFDDQIFKLEVDLSKEFDTAEKKAFLEIATYSDKDIRYTVLAEIIKTSDSLKLNPVNADTTLLESSNLMTLTGKEIKDKKEQIIDLSRKKWEELNTLRSHMQPIFADMFNIAKEDMDKYSSHSAYYKACYYFINNFNGLTLCLKNAKIPLDNNTSERGMKGPVIGRKTWYGSHSPAGAEASAVHFTVVESCKLCGVNPREYYPHVVDRIKRKLSILTPFEYGKLNRINTELSKRLKLEVADVPPI